MTMDEQISKIASEYLPAFLGFAMSKTGNFPEAEELAQEIAYQCVSAIRKGNIASDFNAYIWSIAHNTFKRWCGRKTPLSLDGEWDSLTNIISSEIPAIEQIIEEDDANTVRAALARLASNYRKTIVCFYYDELSIHEIGKRLSISENMVKFYLRAGKQKLKEAIEMQKTGEKSFHPSEFSIYKSSVDFSKVNVWEVFKRKLPCQIALICHDKALSVSEISLETGTPAVYIEDEVQILLDAGVMIQPVKNKYRTNFMILGKNAVGQIKEQFTRLYNAYVPYAIEIYERYLPELKKAGIFNFDASPNQWAWFFALHIPDFDYTGNELTAEDYPQILSCGSKAIVFAEEAQGSAWASGRTPTFLDKCTVFPCDIVIFGEHHCQKELRSERKAQALYDIYCGIEKDEDKEIYAELIAQNYAFKAQGKMYCNVAVSTVQSRKIAVDIDAALKEKFGMLCADIRNNITRIVSKAIPPQLRSYAKGYTETWISFYAGIYLLEALYDRGFILLPEANNPIPLACEIVEK